LEDGRYLLAVVKVTSEGAFFASLYPTVGYVRLIDTSGRCTHEEAARVVPSLLGFRDALRVLARRTVRRRRRSCQGTRRRMAGAERGAPRRGVRRRDVVFRRADLASSER